MVSWAFNQLWILVAILPQALAQSSVSEPLPVVTVLLDPIIGVTYAGSVVEVRTDATLYSIGCTTTATTSIPPNLCSHVVGLTVLQGVTTYSAEFTAVINDVSTIEQFNCVLSETLGYCTDTVSAAGVATTFLSTYTEITSRTSHITITAGAEKLSPSTLPKSVSQSIITSTTKAAGAAKETVASTVSTAGVPRVTQRGVLAGIVGMVAAGVMG